MLKVSALLAGLAGASFASAPAFADTSVYTDLNTATGDTSACETLAASDPEEGGEWSKVRCAGPAGAFIYIDYADARDALRIGENGEGTPFIGPFTSFGPKAKWRLRDRKPYALIVRMILGGTQEGQWLTVHRVPGGPGDGCLVGYVDARANPGANIMARELASDVADRRCNTIEPVVRGKRSATMQAILDLPSG